MCSNNDLAASLPFILICVCLDYRVGGTYKESFLTNVQINHLLRLVKMFHWHTRQVNWLNISLKNS